MSFAHDGLKSKIKTHTASIFVQQSHSLIQLANRIPWDELAEIALVDLKVTTTKGFWHVGRKLHLRVHLGILILQARSKKTDQAIVQEISENAIYQAFCGASLVADWKCPHANKVQEFRSRLSAKTQMKINERIVKLAVEDGFADPKDMDIDSTVQEANMGYPSDARLMLQLAEKCHRIVKAFRLNIPFDLRQLRAESQKYFFAPKNKPLKARREIFATYYNKVRAATLPIIEWAEQRLKQGTSLLKWNNRLFLKQVGESGKKYLDDVAHFVETHTLKPGKILSFHLRQVTCIRKGKVGKENEFGRVFQLGRIGNLLIALCATDIRLSDKVSVAPMIEKHAELFGKGTLESAATDKAYYSAENIQTAQKAGVQYIGIQAPANLKRKINPTNPEILEQLRCRRAGMEPLIGHAKRFGLGKSKMKTDETTHASGFRSLIGFNLSQLERYMKSKIPKIAT